MHNGKDKKLLRVLYFYLWLDYSIETSQEIKVVMTGRDWCSSECQLIVFFSEMLNPFPNTHALTPTHTHTPSQVFMTRLMELAASESGSRLTYDKKELALECIVQLGREGYSRTIFYQ